MLNLSLVLALIRHWSIETICSADESSDGEGSTEEYASAHWKEKENFNFLCVSQWLNRFFLPPQCALLFSLDNPNISVTVRFRNPLFIDELSCYKKSWIHQKTSKQQRTTDTPLDAQKTLNSCSSVKNHRNHASNNDFLNLLSH